MARVGFSCATYFGHDRLWPTAFPTLATTYFGHDLLWPRPTGHGLTDFGHDQLWAFSRVGEVMGPKGGAKEWGPKLSGILVK